MVKGWFTVRARRACADHYLFAGRPGQRPRQSARGGVAGFLRDARGLVRFARAEKSRRPQPRAAVAESAGRVESPRVHRLERERRDAARRGRAQRTLALHGI